MKRIAILIGNDNYDNPDQRLKCAVNDATALEQKLKEVQFDTSLFTDIGRYDLASEITDFSRKLDSYDVGLFFFAGHGFQVKGENYIACKDTQFEDDISISHTAYKLQEIIEDFDNSSLKIKILIVDACRTMPNSTRGSNSTFAPIMAPKGTIIAFATSPGQGAKEDPVSGHGYYTKALLKHLLTKNISIEEMFKRVRNTVYMETQGKQITWEHTSLLGDFSFNDYSSVDSDMAYSKIALADADYEPVNHAVCYEMIKMALTYDFNEQNRIPSMLDRNKLQVVKEAPDDIFVLGRVLYQASHRAFNVQHYFEQLHEKLTSYPADMAEHLLNGMAYEMFFDDSGKLRRVFDMNAFSKNVLEELWSDRFNKCGEYIYSQLKEYSQNIIYFPGKKLDFEVFLKEYEDPYADCKVYRISEIFLDGINVMYNSDGTDYYSIDDDYRFGYSALGLNEVETKVIERVAGSRRGVNIQFDIEDKAKEDNKIKVYWSDGFRLLKYID